MVGAARVVAGNKRVEERDAVFVCGLHAAEGGGVDDGLDVGVAVAGVVEDAAVNALRRELECAQELNLNGLKRCGYVRSSCSSRGQPTRR